MNMPSIRTITDPVKELWWLIKHSHRNHLMKDIYKPCLFSD